MKIAMVDFDYPDSFLERQLCQSAGVELSVADCRSEEGVIAAAQGAQGMITSYADITKTVLEALAPTLRVVCKTGTGIDNIDIDAATHLGIKVCNVAGYGTEVISDHAIALALDCLRRVTELDRNMRNGVWDYSVTRPMGQCRGRTFAVVGMGSIGKAVARKAAGLGFNVVCASRSLTPGTCTAEGYPVLSFAEAYRIADVLSFHTALTPETRHMLDADAIATLKQGAVVVNTSRGAVIDTVALANALQEGRLWGAGIDVFEEEPLGADHQLFKAPHVVLTPHAAYWSEESGVELRTRACRAAIDVVKTGHSPECLN